MYQKNGENENETNGQGNQSPSKTSSPHGIPAENLPVNFSNTNSSLLQAAMFKITGGFSQQHQQQTTKNSHHTKHDHSNQRGILPFVSSR